MEHSAEAKDMALFYAYLALVRSLKETGTLDAEHFLGTAKSARMAMERTGHSECVAAFDDMFEEVTRAVRS